MRCRDICLPVTSSVSKSFLISWWKLACASSRDALRRTRYSCHSLVKNASSDLNCEETIRLIQIEGHSAKPLAWTYQKRQCQKKKPQKRQNMLARMWRNWNPRTLLVGLWNSVATVEKWFRSSSKNWTYFKRLIFMVYVFYHNLLKVSVLKDQKVKKKSYKTVLG